MEVGSLVSGRAAQSDEEEGRGVVDAGTRGREWKQAAMGVKQPKVESRPTQSGQDRGLIGRASHCRMDSLVGFHCRAGAGPVK